MKFITQYKGLPKQIYVLFIARTINSLGFFIFPFMTLFLSSRIGFTESDIGIFLFLASVVYIPGAIIGGKLADYYSRKYTYIFATLAANIIFFICGFLGNAILIPILLIPAFFFNSIASTGSSAMLMDLTDPTNRQESFSIMYLGMNIGVAIGPLIAGLLFENYTSWIFWGDAISGILAICLVLAFIKDTKPTHEDYENIINSGRKGINSIMGNVTIAGSNEPLKGVVFTFFGRSKDEKPIVKKSTEKGNFKILNMPEGKYKVSVKKMGFKEQSLEVVVANGERTVVKVEMWKE